MNKMNNHMIKHNLGITLIELIIAVTLLGIVLATAVPQFSKYTNNSRRSTNINLFVSSLNLARSEAITNNVRVSLCTSSNGTACDVNKSWEDGWLVFTDINGDGVVDAGDSLIRVFPKLYKREVPKKDVTLSEIEPGNLGLTKITYTSKGNVDKAATFMRCADIGEAATNNAAARAIFISFAGRVRLSKGNHKRDNVTDLQACPV